MGKLKLNHFALDDNFHLIAIHSNSEIFKIAFEINNRLKVSLKRIEDISFKDKKAHHSIYKYESLKYDSKMFLFSNKSTLEENQISQELLFQDLSQINFILSEFPKVEYFLKIEQGEFDITWLINNLKICSGILSCYKVEIKNEKSKYNLIFE
ncbi:MAG: IPExxxVDY family protein [Flavobacteriaceae bacterium]|nr:IPExxxVDY family protein [Flavobacteriaceae bacterium]